MKQRGRQSKASLDVRVDGKPPRLVPPRSLPKAERTVFLDLINAVDLDHFRPSDMPLLLRYVENIVLADRAAVELRRHAVSAGKPSPWLAVQEKATRNVIALSMRLRLSPQSRLDSKVVARQQVRHSLAPWEIDPQ
jgi:phage terminase small subunit